MAARRCSTCGINYPTIFGFTSCPVHDTPTDWINNVDVDEDWEYAAARLRERIEPKEAESLEDLIPLISGTVTLDRAGHYFIHAWDVYDAVRTRLAPDALVRVGKQTFEVLEYLEDRREYWVRPFETKVTDENLAAWLDG